MCLFFLISNAQSSVKTIDIPPDQTASKVIKIKGDHQAFWNTDAARGHSLLVSIGGTNSKPSDLAAINTTAAELGYDVIAVDYDNHVISTTCKESSDPKCFDHFREEITTGKSVSPLVEVDTANGIESRMLSLLQYLKQRDSTRWGAYMTNDKVAWQKVVVIGHSQGSGHAAYLAKKHLLRAAILLAGPQDRFSNGQKVAWLHKTSKTPRQRYFAFLHKDDFFGSDHQLANLSILRNDTRASSDIVVSTVKVEDPHMAVIFPQFSEVWKKLLIQAKTN